ncbi:hypothetical protein BLNAU_12736 [Blattamonas nauphoetae]|uniref:Uncharacterized protein n=1 Tax=Blattamonas nauphoetae TaxID=2049346 RepID=A0ABQ9XIS2_9EUKA|nr:hypothetical protein BLNAU_12736 [Blattamonas nauphoetae]
MGGQNRNFVCHPHHQSCPWRLKTTICLSCFVMVSFPTGRNDPTRTVQPNPISPRTHRRHPTQSPRDYHPACVPHGPSQPRPCAGDSDRPCPDRIHLRPRIV